MLRRAFALLICVTGCTRVAATPTSSSDDAGPTTKQATSGVAPDDDAGAIADAGPPEVAQLDPDGDDDPEDPGTGTAPTSGRWEKVGTPPLALTRICDLTPLHGALYAAHANQPLGTDGATITRYRPGAERPFSVAFDWNRPGEPVKGGGAGQGFVRVHAIDGRLFVPDADPPYGGLGLVDHGTEGYVFVSDDKGTFAKARAPHFRPPAAPDLSPDGGARAGAGVLPRAYHVLDTIKFRGSYWASTGSVPPKQQAWRGDSPGALHRASPDGARWIYETDYPFPYKDGVWRLTYMVRFKDRLYAGIQDYNGREPNDFMYFTPDGTSAIRHEDAHPIRVTRTGAAGTLRWWVDTRAKPHRLYWLAWTKTEGIGLFVTTDGDTWSRLPIPPEAGVPTDVTRFRDAVVILTTNGLHRLEEDGTTTEIALVDPSNPDVGTRADKKSKSPFEVTDFFCVAPLAVLDDVLYAGGQRGGALYRLAE
ncbi:MAG: hypothetical protein KIT84_03140 [Labilithrix sp.]|nr:hypothetical protein [Labilithrix sp.]MCW5809977.1 hypothetical protein [Labilithrix sp.]